MKALNVFGIIIAWLLSIVLVVMLIAAPLSLSALSVLDTKNVVEVVSKGLTEGQESAAANRQKTYAIQNLSASSGGEKSLAEAVLDALDLEEIEEIAGEKIDEEVIASVLASDALTEVFEAYAGDIADALTGESGKKQFTAKNLKEIVHDNLDEIIEAVEDSGIKLSKSQKKEIKSKIDDVVKRDAAKIVDLLPDPEEIAETIVEDDVVGEAAAAFFAAKNTLKVTIVGSIIVLSLLIFFLRYPGFRGLRWLASDLFTAGGINVVICLGLGIGTSAVKELVEEMDSSILDGIVSKFLAQLTTGVIVRTVIMLVAAALLLVAYYLLKIFVRKKRGNKASVAAVPAAPAFASAPAAPVVMPTPPVFAPVSPVIAPAPACKKCGKADLARLVVSY